MTVEFGHFALTLALIVALVQTVVPLIGASRGSVAAMDVGRTAAIVQAGLIAIAFFALMRAFVVSDFSVVNVAANSHTAKPMLYKVAGTWASHEGSMLLWVLILALFGAAVALFGRRLPGVLRARALAVQGGIGVGFLVFILFTSNPFARLAAPPAEGDGLNPLLQDPGLAFHPPFLYLGYVGFSVAFSFAIAALIGGRVDAAWARWVRPWTLAAWSFLTVGIALGSWWAYYELGWGGWWYWDPVENASLMPWLAGTALLHSAIVVEKREALKGWTIFLAILTFAFSLLGTFLVRSGVLTSVHAFATDPARGVFILGLLVFIVGGSLVLFAWRGPQLEGGGLFRPISREGGLLLNNLLLAVGAATVLLGTVYPLILEGIGGGKVSVGPPFFTAVFVPLMVPLIVAMAIGPLLPWKRGDLAVALGRLWVAAAAAALAVALAMAVIGWWDVVGLAGLALAAWLFVGTLVDLADRVALGRTSLVTSLRRLAGLPRGSLGTTFAHAGLAIAIAGMTASSVWKQEDVRVMAPGDTVPFAGYRVTFEGSRELIGPNYLSTMATLRIDDGDRPVAVLHPERRRYPAERQETTEAGIRTTIGGDFYAAIGRPEGNAGAHVVRLYHNPLVSWIWAGALFMVLGGVVSLADRRFRVGAPVPARRPLPESAAVAGE